MMPAISCSIGSFLLFPRTTLFTPRKDNRLTRCMIFQNSTSQSFISQSFPFPHSKSMGFFMTHKSSGVIHRQAANQVLATVGTNMEVEEPVADSESNDAVSQALPTSAEAKESSSKGAVDFSPAQSKRTRPARKSEMPPVKNEDLLPGATFTGKVRSIQPFGAFVDFGAFTDGLVHVSQLSDSFVKEVGKFVSVGQEVTVRLLEVNFDTARISLTMREVNDGNKLQERKDASSTDVSEPRPVRKGTAKSNQKRNEVQKSSKFVRGQILNGTVKNITRAGAFISLPDDEEGFLPSSEESQGHLNIMGASSLQIGQEVNVRILRITRGQVTLTMKKEEDVDELNLKLNKGVWHVATNPFEVAFRKNEAIAAFLEERERMQKSAEVSVPPISSVEQTKRLDDQTETEPSTTVVENPLQINNQVSLNSELDRVSSDDVNSERTVSETYGDSDVESTQEDKGPKTFASASTGTVAGALEEESNNVSTTSGAQDEVSSSEIIITDQFIENVDAAATNDNNVKKEPKLVGNEVSLMTDGAAGEDIVSEATDNLTNDGLGMVEPSILEKEVSSASNILEPNEPSIKFGVEEGEIKTDLLIESVEGDSLSENAESEAKTSLEEKQGEIGASLHIQNEMQYAASNDATKDSSSTPDHNSSVILNDETETTQETTIKAAVSPVLVKQLREETGAGMMDCKRALVESECDIIRAQEFLRKKGLASAENKANRATADGRVGSYVHDSRIGVLIEVNCETDFVSRGDIFKQLVDDLAMQVAACPQVQYLVTEDVPEEIVSKEREIEMQKEDLLKKPEQIRSKIVEGRIRKRLEEYALLEQPYIKNDKMVVKDWIKQMISTIGENIKVERFVRYNLGEGLEKKSQDFAAEVAAQTTVKSPPMIEKDPSVAEANQTTQKPPTIAVSAALVKQLREETGAGMMDCKKALTETGCDLVKAQEYLRKKGLSSADKKSSRLAAEGRIASYIHDSRIGVLIEVNCETDFVSRSEKFKELVDDLAMQVVACPQVQFVSLDEIPMSIVSKERGLEMQREDLLSKPENIREKMVEGRLSKRLGELALLEQPFIKDDSILVKDLVKQTIAAISENIKVRRFVRFSLGELIGVEKMAVKT